MLEKRWWRTVGSIGVLGAMLAVPAEALAQDAPAPAAAAEAKDVVRLKNGGLLRGTISELVPGDTVTIVTATGKTREIAMAEVAYAGPADKDPDSHAAPAATAAAPASTTLPSDETTSEVTVRADKATLKLESEPPGLTFHRASGSAFAAGSGGVAVARGYQRLCTAPCEVTLPAGSEVLAISEGNGFPREAGAVTLPAGTSRVKGSLESRSGMRVAGWVIAVGSIVGGTALMLTASKDVEKCDDYIGCRTSSELDGTKLILGAVVLGAGSGVGFFMAFRPDVAKVDVGSRSPALALPPARGFVLSGTM
jgi:hypothetical protein